jgi:hypothetical protein
MYKVRCTEDLIEHSKWQIKSVFYNACLFNSPNIVAFIVFALCRIGGQVQLILTLANILP